MGRCDCGNPSNGFTTYTFWQGEVQRCFTVFIPNERAGEVLPVVFGPNCYAGDVLMSIDGTSTLSEGNQAAARYGYAKVGISSPTHAWEFGNNGVVNDDKPMPCSDEDSVDIAYVRTIIQWLESQPDQFDSSTRNPPKCLLCWNFYAHLQATAPMISNQIKHDISKICCSTRMSVFILKRRLICNSFAPYLGISV